MIRFVLLDLDDTILDFLKTEAVALGKTLRREGITPTDALIERFSEINTAHWKRLEKGELTRLEVKRGRFQCFFDELGVKTDVEAARLFYEQSISEGHIFIPGAQELLDALYGKYRLFIVSNGSRSVQTGRIASAQIGRYFEAIFLSEDVGYDKPSVAFFDRCFAKIEGFDPKDAIIVGDSLTSDILGGIGAGIKTCWFNFRGRERDPSITPDYEIDRLSALIPLLHSI